MLTSTTQLITDLITAWNNHDVETIAALYAPDYHGVDVAYATPRQGRADMSQTMSRYLLAFPDMHFIVEELVVQDNRAALAWIGRGTHRGKLMNIPPTGRVVEVRGSSFFTVANGQITHSLHIWDVAGALRAIGLLPEL
jgi:steroid delta-isomerase-like uncharacterized protein